ncbi:hypothetical protein SAMN04488564_1154 [Lentzea waywayandensis]|uniref:Uncharacterized protein n=1 Tax=Lentzea waywayandensis TaxID=84724 RepID=A0A1I6FFH5_9PSEU|nr:hypothetical protein SAMN04488564_1154 [Lentzea waywayandensis]
MPPVWPRTTTQVTKQCDQEKRSMASQSLEDGGLAQLLEVVPGSEGLRRICGWSGP